MKVEAITSDKGDKGKTSARNIPILIDDVKKYKDFEMARCTYFTIECDVPALNWMLELGNKSIPYHLLGLSGIIYKPMGNEEVFESMPLIDNLFDVIEEHPSLFVDTNDIWLPNFLFHGPLERGQVYRIEDKLLNEAHLFREDRISKKQFLKVCEGLRNNIQYSKIETESFRKWGDMQIEMAKESYPKNKELELKWEDKPKKE